MTCSASRVRDKAQVTAPKWTTVRFPFPPAKKKKEHEKSNVNLQNHQNYQICIFGGEKKFNSRKKLIGVEKGSKSNFKLKLAPKILNTSYFNDFVDLKSIL